MSCKCAYLYLYNDICSYYKLPTSINPIIENIYVKWEEKYLFYKSFNVTKRRNHEVVDSAI